MNKISIKKEKRKQLNSGILIVAGLLFVFISCNQTDKSPFHDFQERRLQALKELEKTPAEQLQPVKLEVTTTAEQRSGVRRIRIRGHQIISDSGYDFAGYSLGPGSPESTLTVIASDISDTYLSQAALKGVRIDSLGVSISSRRDSVPPPVRILHPHNLLYTIYVKSPASDEQLEELRLLTEKYSPVFNLASTKQVVESQIEYKQTPKDLVINPPYQPGLREYLTYKRAALLARQSRRAPGNIQPDAAELLPGDPQQPGQDRLHVEVDPVSGVRRVHIRYFNFIHDNPAYLAGNDLGPSSQEHFLAVLTSCITHITEIQAASREIALDTLAVSAEGTFDLRAGRPGFEDVPPYLHNIRYTLHVSSPHTGEEIEALREAVEAVCPIYSLYISEQKIEGRIVRENFDSYRVHPQYYTDSRN